jgi:hypothetical protein
LIDCKRARYRQSHVRRIRSFTEVTCSTSNKETLSLSPRPCSPPVLSEYPVLASPTNHICFVPMHLRNRDIAIVRTPLTTPHGCHTCIRARHLKSQPSNHAQATQSKTPGISYSERRYFRRVRNLSPSYSPSRPRCMTKTPSAQ